MKSLLAAAAAALVLTVATAAAAQTPAPPVPPSRCPDFPAPPTLPHGATARASEMQRANDAHQTWSQQMETVRRCRLTEVRDLRAQYEPMRVHAETRVEEYNAAIGRQRQICRSWVTELNDYYTRQHAQDHVDPVICEGGQAAAAAGVDPGAH